MSEYEAIGVYAGFAFLVFAIGIIWRYHREWIKRRFPLVNYHSRDHDDPKGHRVI